MALVTTGINSQAAAQCMAQVLGCEVDFSEAIWLGTSGWSPQVRRWCWRELLGAGGGGNGGGAGAVQVRWWGW